MSTVSTGCKSRRMNLKLKLVLMLAVPAAIIGPIAASPSHRQAVYTIPAHDGAAITYRLTPYVDANPRHVNVEITFDINNAPEKVSVQMPDWSPGDYHIDVHAKYVQAFKAVGIVNGSSSILIVKHPDVNTWDVYPNGAKHLILTYAIPQVPAGIFSENVQIQRHYGFINGPAALVYVVGHKDASAKLIIASTSGWTSTVPLEEQKQGGEVVTNTFLAPDYDTLADSPIVFADNLGMKVYTFQQDGTDFTVVCFRNPDRIASVPDLIHSLKTIAHTESTVMGGMDTNHYSFVFDVDGFSAGLEHLNSFRIGLPSDVPPRMLSSFIGHEFFHQWNVKRIRPLVLGPFDYINPPHTHNLWFAEGVTEYYAQMCSHRGGFTKAEDVLAHFNAQNTLMLHTEARKSVTAEESSMRVWEAGNSEGFGGLSYYNKGELIGLCLDLKIRAVTDGKKSLDDVMRLLMKRHAPPLPGYGEDELRLTVNEVAGQDLSDLYNLLVRSTNEMPIPDLLQPFGLDDQFRPLSMETPEQRTMRELWLEGTRP